MAPRVRDHIDTVLRSAHGELVADVDALIQQSWQRCARDHRLDPTRSRDTIIVPQLRLREHQGELGAFLPMAKHAVAALHGQLADLGYVVLLTDAHGVTVDFLGDPQVEGKLRKAGLWLGSDWSEGSAGTNGVGTCIATKAPLIVHQDEHFDSGNIRLSCTTAPIFDSSGRLCAVVDVSAMSSPGPKTSQHGVLSLVKACATDLENATFFASQRGRWIVRLGSSPHYLDVRPEYLLALDERGLVVGHNRSAQLLFDAPARPLLGRRLDDVLDLSLTDLGGAVDRPRACIAHAFRSAPLYVAASAPAVPPASPTRPRPAPSEAGWLEQRLERASRLLEAGVNVLVTGETGTGKEHFARALHQRSARRHRPFVAVSCAAIPDTLIESELFGHLPGSFSGASAKGKRGLVGEADGGTLFLDEIGELSPATQVCLLRVLAEGEVLPLGATRPVKVDLRVIAATHRNLDALVRSGAFREDLFYRINGGQLSLPPLRARPDREWMIDHMLEQLNPGKPVPRLAREVRALLLAHAWPGNLRELHNVLAYACSMHEGGRIELSDLPEQLGVVPEPLVSGSNEAEHLERQLRASGWNIAAAARALGIARMTLYRRMKRLHVTSPNARDHRAGRARA